MENNKLFIPGIKGAVPVRLPVPVYFENKDWRFISTLIWAGLQVIVIFMLIPVMGKTGILYNNLLILVKHFLLIALPAIPMLVIFSNGSVDLSVGAIAMLSGIIAGSLGSKGSPVVGIIQALIIAACIGAVTGFLTGWLKIPGIFVTFIVMMAIQPLGSMITGGTTILMVNLPGSLYSFGWIVFIPLAAFAFLWLQFPGWNTEKVKMAGKQEGSKFDELLRIGLPYVASSLTAGMTGIIWTSMLQAAAPKLGTRMEFDLILVAVLSGTLICSRYGNVLGLVLSAFIITLIKDMMIMMGINPFFQQFAITMIGIIGVVFLYSYHVIVGVIYRNNVK